MSILYSSHAKSHATLYLHNSTLAFCAKTLHVFTVPFDACPMTFTAARLAIEDRNACIAFARASAFDDRKPTAEAYGCFVL